jgi:hypothetical protein
MPTIPIAPIRARFTRPWPRSGARSWRFPCSRSTLVRPCCECASFSTLVMSSAECFVALAGESATPQLLWSTSPLSVATLAAPDETWLDVPDTSVTVELPNEAVVVVSYDVSVMHVDKIQDTDAAPTLDDVGELSFRIEVDGTPYRQSATTVDDRDPLVTVASGHLILEIPGGQHYVSLQWQKRGTRVQQWVVLSDILDGFAGGRHLFVSAQHRFLWHTQPLTSAIIESTAVWEVVPDMTLAFRLPEVTSVRFFYQLPVRPEFIQYSRGE